MSRSPEKSFVGPLDDVGLGAAEGRISVSSTACAVEAVQALVDGVLEDRFAADALVDDGRRHLALAEAGDVDLLGDVAVGVRDAGLQVVGGDRDVELDARGAELLDRGLHLWSSPVLVVAGLTAETAVRVGRCASGRQDSNLRSSAPKADALATTLRPVCHLVTAGSVAPLSGARQASRSLADRVRTVLGRSTTCSMLISTPARRSLRGCSSMVEPQSSKLMTRVRFPSSPLDRSTPPASGAAGTVHGSSSRVIRLSTPWTLHPRRGGAFGAVSVLSDCRDAS